eukprot:4414426-Ditylum_brightwellii.AAC.1
MKPYLWLRDSAAQNHPLLLSKIYNGRLLVQMDAKLERIVSGLIQTAASNTNTFQIDNSKVYTKFEREDLA